MKGINRTITELVVSVKKLEGEVTLLKKKQAKQQQKYGVVEEVLAKDWDNEYDDRWNAL